MWRRANPPAPRAARGLTVARYPEHLPRGRSPQPRSSRRIGKSAHLILNVVSKPSGRWTSPRTSRSVQRSQTGLKRLPPPAWNSPPARTPWGLELIRTRGCACSATAHVWAPRRRPRFSEKAVSGACRDDRGFPCGPSIRCRSADVPFRGGAVALCRPSAPDVPTDRATRRLGVGRTASRSPRRTPAAGFGGGAATHRGGNRVEIRFRQTSCVRSGPKPPRR